MARPLGAINSATDLDTIYVPLTTIKRTLWPFGVYQNVSPMTAQSFPYAAAIDRTITYISLTYAFNVLGTNNGSNYWRIYLFQWSDSVQVKLLDTSAASASTPTIITTTSFDIASSAVDKVGIFLRCTPVGSPAALYLAGPILEVTC
jgi:hypothetical protein